MAREQRVTVRRVVLAFALAPLGAVIFLIALFSRATDTPRDWFTGGPYSLLGYAIIFGIAYAAGAVLLPVFLLLERVGRGSWKLYVPIAAAAGALVGLILAGSESRPQIVAWPLLCAGTGAACAVVFSAVLALRPDRGSGERV